jgi:hypothetical protein
MAVQTLGPKGKTTMAFSGLGMEVVAGAPKFDCECAMPDILSSGAVAIETFGDSVRLTFHRPGVGEAEGFQIPVAPIVMPMSTMMALAEKIAAAYALTPIARVAEHIGCA